MLVLAFETLGYGIYPKSLVTLIRIFTNDAAEGISVKWYQNNAEYDAEEFGYYDVIENEPAHNAFGQPLTLWN